MPENSSKDMRWKPVLAVFALTLVLYLSGFYWIESSRQKNGPWKLTFNAADSSQPEIVIEQDDLGVAPTTIQFKTPEILPLDIQFPTSPVTLSFDLNQQEYELPFGEIKYRDPTFLPGVVTLEVFGAIVEFLPRTLIINQEEIPWNSKTNISVDCSTWNGNSSDKSTDKGEMENSNQGSSY